MIFPLWVGYDRPRATSSWPLLLLMAANIGAHIYLEDLHQADPARFEALVQAVGDESLTFGHLFLSSFVHAGWLHLIGNMWFMWLFGMPIASGLRPSHFLALYCAGVVFASLMDLVLSDNGMIGASGGVSCLMGFFVTHFLRQPVTCLLVVFTIRLPAWLLVFLYVGNDIYGVYSGAPGIAYWAHIGGFLLGMLAGRVVHRLDARHYTEARL